MIPKMYNLSSKY